MTIKGKTAGEIYDCVRALAQSKQLLPGAPLPPVRDLATTLGIGRNTVASAYRRLTIAGITSTQGRLGTIIRGHYATGEQEGAMAGTPLTDLASGNPNAHWLPDPVAALRARQYEPKLYGEPTVNAGLQQHLRAWMQADCPDPFEIDLAHGAVDAIERLLQAYLVSGDKVAVEDPCFLSSINTLRTWGLHPVGVAVDREGMQADALEQALAKGARAIILTPRAHNPTGYSLSESRARAISRVLGKYPQALVVIDDHFALLSNVSYYSVIPHGATRWALVRSFTKALGPDIRVAAVASDPTTSNQLRLRLASGTSWVSHLLQNIVEASLTDPSSVALMRSARADYIQRRQTLEKALMAQRIDFASQGDGLNLWIPVPSNDQTVALALAHKGWLVRHGGSMSVQDPIPGLRITISSISPAMSEALARDIKLCLV